MKITEIGYFGRTTNVKDAPAVPVDAFAAAIASLPRRARPSADIIPLRRERSK
jgi:hypothetical protein